MRTRSLSSWLVPLVALPVLAVATIGHAQSHNMAGHCYVNADKSGWCYGTYAGVRGSGEQVEFILSDSTRSVFAYDTGTAAYHTCTPTPGSDVAAVWPAALSARSWYNFGWDASGRCTWVEISNDSDTTWLQ